MKLKMQKTYKIKKIIKETPKAISLILEGRISYKPGQTDLLAPKQHNNQG